MFSAVPFLRAQTDSLILEGDRLHRQYRFEEALERFAEAARSTRDADTLDLLRERVLRAQDALAMTDICSDLVCIARERFSRKDFFLFYPLKNQGWRTAPNDLDARDDGFPVYAPKGVRSVCFSAPDPAGVRDLYVTRDQDTLWSAPELMGEALLSLGDEVFPMLSADGKTLTFSSDGFHGAGGFDLYRSVWDEASLSWSEPENMGFPYSSTGDDFLLVDTPDGRFTLFASNRECSPDSVYVYVLEKQVSSVRLPVRDPETLSRMASLLPVDDPARLITAPAVAGENPAGDPMRDYRFRMAEARALKDSVYACERALDDLRLRLALDGGEGRAALSALIAEKESALVPLRTQMEEAGRAVRRIEQSFLQSGAVAASDRADREVVGARSAYAFSKNSIGARLHMKLARPQEPEPSYRVAPMGRFAQSTALPEGIVYQILLFTSARHATLDEIKGLSPVYERLTASLRYTYSVGVFRSFAEALSHLNPVRYLGFPEAEIVAFIDGRAVPVSEARRAGR